MTIRTKIWLIAVSVATAVGVASWGRLYLTRTRIIKDAQTSAEDRFRSLPPEKQEELRQRFRELQALPPDERAELQQNLEKLDAMSPLQRQAVSAGIPVNGKIEKMEEQLEHPLEVIPGNKQPNVDLAQAANPPSWPN